MTDPIKAKLQKLCPDVMYLELKSGERLAISDPNITLAVVLRAIGKEITGKKDEHGEPIQIEITSWGMFIGSYNWEETPAFWNLEKDRWEDQNRETQLFIGSLLGVEK